MYNHEEYIEQNKQTNSGWRLPTIQELASLINYEKREPACDLEDAISSRYWSSTTRASTSSYVWVVDFNGGFQYYYFKTYNLYVRCVRAGRNGLEWAKTSEEQMTWYEAIKYAENYKGN